MVYRCKYCGIQTNGKQFCTDICRVQFYYLIKENKINNTTPEQYIKDVLNNPIDNIRIRFDRIAMLAYVKTNLEMMKIKGLYIRAEVDYGRYLLYLKYDRRRVENGKEKEEDQVGQAGAADVEESKRNS